MILAVLVSAADRPSNVQYAAPFALTHASTGLHRTFMDTRGRTALTLSAINLVDDVRERDIVITYDYPSTAGLRKPAVITLAMFTVFVAAWVVGRLDTSIGKKKTAWADSKGVHVSLSYAVR